MAEPSPVRGRPFTRRRHSPDRTAPTGTSHGRCGRGGRDVDPVDEFKTPAQAPSPGIAPRRPPRSRPLRPGRSRLPAAAPAWTAPTAAAAVETMSTGAAAPKTRRSIGPAFVLTAVVAAAALSSGGTYLVVNATTAHQVATPNPVVNPAVANPATPAAPVTPANPAPAPAVGQASIPAIVKAVGPAVVTITADGRDLRPTRQPARAAPAPPSAPGSSSTPAVWSSPTTTSSRATRASSRSTLRDGR